MRLTWRDVAATVPVAAAAALYWAFRADVDLPLVSGARVLAVVVFVLGVTACAVNGGMVPAGDGQPADTWRSWFGAHGLVAFVLALLVLITASTGLLAALVAVVVLLWVVTTARHALTPAGHAPGAVGGSPPRQPARR